MGTKNVFDRMFLKHLTSKVCLKILCVLFIKHFMMNV